MKPKIKELIVVEGKNDTHTLKRYFDCDTIETHGDRVNAQTLDFIKQAQKTRGVIVFTDPDSPGEHIRRVIMEKIPGCKHAWIEKKKARTPKKVGVEHALKDDLWDSLSSSVTFMQESTTLSWQDYIDLGLIGNSKLREAVCVAFHIGKCNAKTCYKRLNQMQITQTDVLEKIQEVQDGSTYRNDQTNERNPR